MTGTARPDFRPLPACPAGTQDLKLVVPSSARPLPCPACLAGSQVSQRYSCFIVQYFPFRLDKPTGAASYSCTLANYKSSARARRAGTGRDQMLPKKLFNRLLFVPTLSFIRSGCFITARPASIHPGQRGSRTDRRQGADDRLFARRQSRLGRRGLW